MLLFILDIQQTTIYGKLPILDLKVWIEKKDDEVDGNIVKYNCVLHEFYLKEVSSKSIIHARSALSWPTKRTILTQEVLRVLKNCSPGLPWEQTVRHLNMMSMRMQFSGYNKKFRYEVFDSALKAYKNMKSKDQAGEVPLYRPREWRRKERENEKRSKRNNWYKKGGYSSVVFIPATPDSELKRKLEDDVRSSGIKVKIVEKAGISCSECSQTYIGETSRNTYMRGREHLRELDNRSKGSVLWSHAKEEHEGKIPDYTCDVTNVFQGDALLRQVSEAVLINKVKPEMNTKKEWNFANIPRARIN
ncbi:hypothetical protein AC249_AIPGENE16189 [Exaiptasia diaphana]|nr:hypothetical protein AC249_AIPGENE16189 [Exaiptasia diaphana]